MTAIQAESQQNGVNPREGIDLEYVETVLVKFTLKSKEELIPGISMAKRQSQGALDQKHLNEAREVRVAERKLQRGSIRPGHFDTGVEVYHAEHGVGSPTLAECLVKEGYGFRDVHFFEQPKGNKKLFVVVFGFEWNAENAENVSFLSRQFAHYAANSWTMSIWDNPNLTSTVNHTDRVQGERPTRKVVAAKKRLFIA